MKVASPSTSRVAPVRDDGALRQHDRALAELDGVRQVVGHHQHGDLERAQDAGELASRGRVEVRRRLVQHEDLRAHGQHGRDRDPAALAEGEVVRRAVGEVGDAHRAQGLHDPRVELGAAQPEVGRPERHVVAHGGHEQLVVGVLEDDADPASHLEQVRAGDRQPRDGDASRAGREDAVEVQHQGRLARAVGAEQGDPLPRVHVQVDPEQCLVAARVGVGDAADVEDGHAHPTRTPTVTTAATSAGERASTHWAGVRRERRGDRHPARPATTDHGEVHALTALVAADEQRPGARRERRPRAHRAGGEAARGAGDAHPPHLVPDDVDVAHHERRDRDEGVRDPQVLQGAHEVARARRHRERHGREHAAGPLEEQGGGGLQAGLGEQERADLHPRPDGDERQDAGEQRERDLDHEPGQDQPRGHAGGREQRGGHEEEGDERRGRGTGHRHDGEDEGEQPDQLGVRRQLVEDARALDVEVGAVAGSHLRTRSRAGGRRRRTTRTPVMTSPTTRTPARPASPPDSLGSSTSATA